MSYERLYAGETTEFSGVLEYSAGVPIPFADLATGVLTAVNVATGAIVNSRNAQNILNQAGTGVTIGSTNGSVLFKTSATDSNLIDPASGGEEHQFDFVFTTTSSPAKVRRITHRIHCASFLGLTSMDEVSLHLPGMKDSNGIISDETRFFVELMIDAVAARMERECDRTFLKPASATAELCSPYEQRWLALRRWPVTKAEITSVKEAWDGNFASATALDAKDYEPTPEGLLIHRSRDWVSGTGSVQVTHSGGLARYVGAVPADLRMAATKQVATWWQRKDTLGVSGESVQGASVTLFFKGGLVEELKDLIPHLKRRNLVF